MFMVKNAVEIVLAFIFVFYNLVWLWAYDFEENEEPGTCNIDLLRPPPPNNVRECQFIKIVCKCDSLMISITNPQVTVVMQCKEKRHDIFVILLYSFTVVTHSFQYIQHQILSQVLIFHILINILSVLWGVPQINRIGLS